MKTRCTWPGDDALMIAYHDKEWGRPTHLDKVHFEFLVLEAAQAGLSWRTVLYKREGYRKWFCDFDPVKVARIRPEKIEKMLLDPSIIRNRLKVKAAIQNAKEFLKVQKEFGSFDKYIWGFVQGKSIINHHIDQKSLPATSEISDALSKDLKKRGFKFVGSTIIYAHMQAVGIVNDHLVSCFRHG